MRRLVAVVGPGEATPAQEAAAEAVGAGLAALGAAVVTGGLGGVMSGASRGAARAGGLVVGLLPGSDRAAANPWVDVVLPTGLGEARDALVAAAAEVVVVVGGSWGTLAEVSLARRRGTPVVVLTGAGTEPWTVRPSATDPGGGPVPGALTVGTPAEAVAAVAAVLRLSEGATPPGSGPLETPRDLDV